MEVREAWRLIRGSLKLTAVIEQLAASLNLVHLSFYRRDGPIARGALAQVETIRSLATHQRRLIHHH